ncbi:hypothetical protein Tco_0469397 [Tanacetum coccineum]
MSLIIEISLGIGDDMVTFDMDRKAHNFTTPVGKIYMIHHVESPSRGNAPSDKSSRFEKSDDLHNENNYMQERSSKTVDPWKGQNNSGRQIYQSVWTLVDDSSVNYETARDY